MSSSQTFVIGQNGHGELILNQFGPVHKLTPVAGKKISKAFSGNQYSIYTDDNYDNLWSAGYNHRGSCGVGNPQATLKKLTPITYFNEHGIKIKQISVNTSGYGSFFISKDNILYACGLNNGGQLGIASKNDIYEPILIPDLENKFVIDIKSSQIYSIAICSDNHPRFMLIITNWTRLCSLSQDVMNLIISFMQTTKLFATTKQGGTGHLEYDEIVNKTGWNMVNSFADKNIIKCALGAYHSMFLEDNGAL